MTGQGVDTTDPENNKFAINQTTGEIYVLKPLDRDLPQGRSQWRFTVFAEDEGGNGLVGFADVLVNLKGEYLRRKASITTSLGNSTAAHLPKAHEHLTRGLGPSLT